MTVNEFLSHVLPVTGYYCLAFKTSNGIHHKVFDTIANACLAANAASNRAIDVYFCISTLNDVSVEIAGHTKTRVSSNCAYTRSLILDVDIRPEKDDHHNDFNSAAVDIVNLSKELALCRPTIVNTGGGFHVYWTAEEQEPSSQFVKKAEYFKQLVLQKFPKLAADPTRIADRTSLLRVPFTRNVKRNATVQIVKEGGKFANALISHWQISNTTSQAVAIRTNTLMGKSPPVKLDSVVSECGQLSEMVTNGGSACTEPLWYAALNIAKHADVPSVWAHTLSKGHSGYSYDSTENKLQQATATGTGPTTCKKFEGLRPAICSKCKHKGNITSPIQLAYGVPQKQSTATSYAFTPPFPYFRRQQGGIAVILKTSEDDPGVEHIVYDYDLYVVGKLKDENTGAWLLKYRYYQPVDGWCEQIAPLEDFSDKKAAFKTLMRGGVTPTYGQSQQAYNVGRYVIDSVRALEKVSGSALMYSQLGWRENDTSFLVGNRLYSPGKTALVELTPSLRSLVQPSPNSTRFTSKGNLQDWIDAFNTYGIPGMEPYAFGALLGFASPLYKFTGHYGIIYNMVGDKGSGKSTVLQMIMSIWSAPEAQVLKESDTVNSAEVILGAMHNLPVTYDEITNIHEQKLSDLCYNITQGRGRNRLQADAKLKQNSATWALIMCSSSNLSLTDKLSGLKADASAESIRIFEVNINSANSPLNKSRADAAFKKLESNYGLAGELYAPYIVNNKAAIITQLSRMIAAIDDDLKMQSSERFWSALLGCVMIGGQISKNLGLHGYDMEKIYEWAKRQIARMRVSVIDKVSDPMSLLSNFLGQKTRNTIVVVNGKVRDSLLPQMRELTQVRIEIAPKLALAFVERRAITEYCKTNNVSMSWWEAQLKDAGILIETSKQKRLNSGASDLPAINATCWVLNLIREDFRNDLKEIISGQSKTNATNI